MAGGLIIAVCGESGAGKSTTTGLLRDEGFQAYSLSGFLRSEAEEATGKPTRPQVQAHGRAMQARHGNDYYARVLVENTDLLAQDLAVVDGLRNLDELAFLRAQAAARGATLVLLALVLDARTRFERVTGRARAGDSPDMQQFIADDARANGAEGDFQNNLKLIEAADWRILNSGNLPALQAQIRDRVKTILEATKKEISHETGSS
ncbi:MAG: hypothetical protein K0B16_12550 [Burkholderiaceae bacterium]|nr:hypothetical protein [Burkholderiaceae bacterium]